MPATATISLSGTLTSTLTGNRVIGPLTASSAAANGVVQQITLLSGANTITVPVSPATNGCIIKLPLTNTAVTTLKGVTGDTGIALGKTTWHVLNWDPAAVPTSFVLTSAADQTGLYTEIIFF